MQFAGSWDQVSGHQAALYSDDPNANTVDRSVRAYTSAGVQPHKLVVGMPLYGRAFMGTSGPGQPYNGVGEGSWENGMWDYKALPQPGAEVINDHRLGVSYSLDRSKGLMISYDTQAIAHQKADYINKMNLGGAMWWELDADKPESSGEGLVRTVFEALGQLEQRENELNYPGSSESPVPVGADKKQCTTTSRRECRRANRLLQRNALHEIHSVAQAPGRLYSTANMPEQVL